MGITFISILYLQDFKIDFSPQVIYFKLVGGRIILPVHRLDGSGGSSYTLKVFPPSVLTYIVAGIIKETNSYHECLPGSYLEANIAWEKYYPVFLLKVTVLFEQAD